MAVGSNSVDSRPLEVLIAGAGIGGLSAAIALRQAGHNVQIFESSRFAMEVGAAIHIPPNVNGVLRRFGLDPGLIGANETEWVTVYTKDGQVLSQKSVAGLKKVYKFPWQLSHRVDLHDGLKRIATSEDGPGRPVKIHLRQKVVSCDPETPSLTLADGKVVKGDLVVGADGVHSVLRSIISGEDIPTFPSGGSAFRFLVPISKIRANPDTAPLVEKPGDLQLWEGTHRRLVIYPCRNNTELNFVCLHPDVESQSKSDSWNNSSSVEDVLRVFDEFYQPMKSILAMAEPDTIKLWRLYDRHALQTWIRGNAALLGDAAHPFLPHQGQGGAQAMEDGAALGALLPLGTRPEEVQARLQLYMKSRYDRATLVQNFSRQMAFKTSEKDEVGGHSLDPLEFSKINFAHDAFEFAQAKLSQNVNGDA